MEREKSFSKAAKRVLILWSVRNRQWRHRELREACDGHAGCAKHRLRLTFRDHQSEEEIRMPHEERKKIINLAGVVGEWHSFLMHVELS